MPHGKYKTLSKQIQASRSLKFSPMLLILSLTSLLLKIKINIVNALQTK